MRMLSQAVEGSRLTQGGKRTGERCGHPLGAEFEPHAKGEAQVLSSPLDELCPSRNRPTQPAMLQAGEAQGNYLKILELENLVAQTVGSSNTKWDSNPLFAWLHDVAALRRAA